MESIIKFNVNLGRVEKSCILKKAEWPGLSMGWKYVIWFELEWPVDEFSFKAL